MTIDNIKKGDLSRFLYEAKVLPFDSSPIGLHNNLFSSFIPFVIPILIFIVSNHDLRTTVLFLCMAGIFCIFNFLRIKWFLPQKKQKYYDRSGLATQWPGVQRLNDSTQNWKHLDQRIFDVAEMWKLLDRSIKNEIKTPVLLTSDSGMGKSLLLELITKRLQSGYCSKIRKDYYSNNPSVTEYLCDEELFDLVVGDYNTDNGDDKLVEDIQKKVLKENSKKYLIFYDQFEKILHNEGENEKELEFIRRLAVLPNIAIVLSCRIDKFPDIFIKGQFKELRKEDLIYVLGKISGISPTNTKNAENVTRSFSSFECLGDKACKVVDDAETSIEQELILHFLAQEVEADKKDPYLLPDLEQCGNEELITKYFDRVLCATGKYTESAQVLYLISKHVMNSVESLRKSQIESVICSYQSSEIVEAIVDILDTERLINKDELSDPHIEVSHEFIAEQFVKFIDKERVLADEIKAFLDQWCVILQKRDISSRNTFNTQKTTREAYVNDYKKAPAWFHISGVISIIEYLVIYFNPMLFNVKIADHDNSILASYIPWPINEISQLMIILLPIITILGFSHSWILYFHVFAAQRQSKRRCILSFFVPPIISPIVLMLWFSTGLENLSTLPSIAGLFGLFGLFILVTILLPSFWIRYYLKRYGSHLPQSAEEPIRYHATRFQIPILAGMFLVPCLILLLNKVIYGQIAIILIVPLLVLCFVYLLWTQAKKIYCMKLFASLTTPSTVAPTISTERQSEDVRVVAKPRC
jgi:hypothetical protein